MSLAVENLLLGIDVGTTAVKAALVDVLGNLQAVDQAEYPLFHVRPAWVEQDPAAWWRATCEAVRKVLAQVPHGAERVLALAVSSQAPTLLPLDEAGQPLHRAMIWMDRRAEAEAVQLAEAVGAGEIHRITGNRPDAFFVAARLLWLRNHEPGILARTRWFVQINGYINYRLTGRSPWTPCTRCFCNCANTPAENGRAPSARHVAWSRGSSPKCSPATRCKGR